VEIPEIGTVVRAGEPFGEVESTKSVSSVYAPVTGRVVERNGALADSPELVNEDPYGDGWMILIEPGDASEIDSLLDAGNQPIVVGGTGLYLRAALADLELRPPVPGEISSEVERDLAKRGPEALHGELDPDLASGVHPNDRKRIARLTELQRTGIYPHSSSEGLWTEHLRRPALLFGLILDRDELAARIDARVDAMVGAGAEDEVRRAVEAGASRTARAAIGFEELFKGEVEAMKGATRGYARRQMTWMRKMPGVQLIDRTGRTDHEVASQIVGLLGENAAR
jgi:tRNA dimethylallyltransferase